MAKKAKFNPKTPAQQPTPEAQRQTQEARITANGRVISEHPSTFITPAKLRALFDDAESNDIQAQHELFADMEERDSAIAAAFSTRKLAVLGLDWRIAEPRDASPAEQQLTQAAQSYFDHLAHLDDLLMDLMDAVGHGFAALEITWQLQGSLNMPARFTPIAQSWFRWDNHDNLLLKTPDNPTGEPLWQMGWVVHRHKNRSVQAARGGLFRTLAWLYMFKHYSAHDFAEFLELYGMPIRIGKYGAGATEKEKQTLLRAVAEIGHNAAGIMPEGMMIELHQAASGTTAGNNPFMTMIEWCEKSATRLILGQTLTSGADGKASTNALGKIHNEVRHDLLVADARRLAQTINQQILEPFLRVNFAIGEETRLPQFEFDTRETADLAMIAEALPKLVDVGVQIPERWARDKLAIPDALDGERLLGRKAQDEGDAKNAAGQPEKGKPPAALNYRHVALNAQGQIAPAWDVAFENGVEDYLREAKFAAQLEPMLQDLGRALAEGEDYEEVENRLIAAYPMLDTHHLQEALTRVLFVADLWGRAQP
jgi:hypothetical protein|nr:MAG TPA: portal [Caudoviricetes sp.]